MATSAAIYHFLSVCLLYPEPDLNPQLRAAAKTTGLPWAVELAESFAGELLETLQTEHTRLFVNNIKGIPCPPYQSAYVDGRLLSATTADVFAIYAKWGIEQSMETADFLPVELQFVAYLIELAEHTADSAPIERARHQFEAEYVKSWLPDFAADLQKHARIAFYQEVGKRLAAL